MNHYRLSKLILWRFKQIYIPTPTFITTLESILWFTRTSEIFLVFFFQKLIQTTKATW